MSPVSCVHVCSHCIAAIPQGNHCQESAGHTVCLASFKPTSDLTNRNVQHQYISTELSKLGHVASTVLLPVELL